MTYHFQLRPINRPLNYELIRGLMHQYLQHFQNPICSLFLKLCLFYMYRYFVVMKICVPYVHHMSTWCPQKSEEGIRSFRTTVAERQIVMSRHVGVRNLTHVSCKNKIQKSGPPITELCLQFPSTPKSVTRLAQSP